MDGHTDSGGRAQKQRKTDSESEDVPDRVRGPEGEALTSSSGSGAGHLWVVSELVRVGKGPGSH